MHVLLLNSARKWIGEAAHVLALAEGLRARGHRATVAVREGCELERRARQAGVPVLPLGLTSRFNPASEIRDLRRLARFVAAEQVDVLHCHRGKDHWIAAAARVLCAGRVRRTPLVRTRHVVTPARRHLFNRWLYASATGAVVAVSRAARASLDGLIPENRPPERDRIVLSAVDLERFRPELRSEALRRRLGCEKDDLLVGLVGRLQNVKGQKRFLRAAALAARENPRLHFLLAGRGSQARRDALQEVARQAGLPAERLTTLGEVENLPALVASLDAGILASIGSEGSSRIVLEYLASGLPVVATCVGGVPDLLEESAAGILVPPRDEAALSRAILELAADAEARRRRGAAARREAESRFAPSRWLDDMDAVYRAVLDAQKTG